MVKMKANFTRSDPVHLFFALLRLAAWEYRRCGKLVGRNDVLPGRVDWVFSAEGGSPTGRGWMSKAS